MADINLEKNAEVTTEQTITANEPVEAGLSLPESYGANLTPERAQKVSALKASIDIHDKGKVTALGYEQQSAISKFSDSILQGVGTREMGEAGNAITSVIGKIKGFDADCNSEKKGLFAFLKKQKSKLQTLRVKYKSVSDNLVTVEEDLKAKDLALGNLSRQFDTMYEQNLQLYEFLTMLIYAGEQTLAEERQKVAEMRQMAQVSGDSMELQKVSDYNDDVTRFARRLHDLKLSRAMAINQAPQIKNIQKGADEVSECIKSIIVTAIPMWKNQMAIALGMNMVQEGLNAVNAAKDTTNQLFLAYAEMNKRLTLQAAEASERAILDIETLNKINQYLIETATGVFQIAQNAEIKRQNDAMQLQENENQLKKAFVDHTMYT